VMAAHEQLAETTACIEFQELADSMDDCFRDKSKDDGPGKADSLQFQSNLLFKGDDGNDRRRNLLIEMNPCRSG
jgi:hypothetical protein